MSSFKNLLSLAAVAACLSLPQQADADNSVELMTGKNSTTLDLKVGVELVPQLQFFTRQLSSINYNNEVSHFGLVSLGHNIWNGLTILVQGQAVSEEGIAPRLGLKYFKPVGDVELYGEVVAIIKESPQVELLAAVGYRPKLIDKIHLAANLEAVTLLNPERGHDYSAQRLRLGLGTGRWEFGPAVNVEEAGGKVDYNLGGSIKLKF